MSPLARKIVRGLFVIGGAMAAISAGVNIVAAYRLLEPSDEAMLGISRQSVVAICALELLLGLVLIFLGLRRRK